MPIVPIESRDRRSSRQHPIIHDGSDLKNLLGHLGERLGHVGEVLDLLQTICELLVLQYQMQVILMLNALYFQPMNTVLVQSDDDSVTKDAAVEIQRWDDDNGVVPIIMDKRAISPKKISDI